ncbi:hypothetical protein UFOVP1616_12 [uncultured Caudovirales phage]|uniref:Uncharacterized protein n=1 Tax=uncultured Caudovirales phage TaxID=2100421 RepID=A0A6J5SM34_9CAUD|nr:hypothetical protein UFOVP1467_28 [uncultured Caudovirales phage]CAB4219631.1 hypothetical protein UFOVP1616_12 [uncultured Caudovirales phage]
MEITYSKHSGRGEHRRTEREWVAPNGHKVLVKTDQMITCRETILGRLEGYARVYYICECGNHGFAEGSPKKAHLLEHDKWTTPASRAHLDKMFEQLLAEGKK